MAILPTMSKYTNDASGRELAEGKKAEQKSADETSEFSENLINTVREPMLALDQDLRVVKVSRSFYDFFKVKPKETVGQLVYDLGNKQWNIPKLRELLEKILPKNSSFDNYEIEHEFPSIGKRTMLLNARQIQRALGKERIILLAIEDITERKKAETELAKTHIATLNLLDEVNKSKSQLEKANKALLELDKFKEMESMREQFFFMTAHELKTPLTPIKMESDMWLRGNYGKITKDQKGSIEIIERNCTRLIRLITDIITLIKIEQKQMKYNFERIDIGQLFSWMGSDMLAQATERGLYLKFKLPADPIVVKADHMRLQQVLSNLIVNALKFTDKGGVTVIAKKASGGALITVSDTGKGIEEKDKKHLFERFYRGKSGASIQGLGLGLFISKTIIDEHGGKIWCESKFGKGTTFYFTLPLNK